MKTTFLLVCWILVFQVFIITASSQEVQRGMKPVEVTIDGTTSTLYEQSHALLIGVSNYSNGLKPLPGVKEDILAVKNCWKAAGF